MSRSRKNQMPTKCAAPPALSDDELYEVLDDDASPQVLRHLEICEFCSERLDKIRQFERSLQLGLHRFDCPPSDQIADYFHQNLTMWETGNIQAHLEHCPLCQKELKYLQTFLALDEEDSALSSESISPLDQVQRLVNQFADQVVRLLTPENNLAYGVLKTRRAQEQPLIYTNGLVSLTLSLEKVIEGLKITGTILDREAEGRWRDGHVEVISLSSDRPPFQAAIDEDEMFVMDTLSPGRFNINIYAVDGHILRLQDLEIQL